MIRQYVLPALLALTAVLPSAYSQRQLGRDPLNEKEVDELRDTAQMPNHRLKAYVGFLRARMESVEHLQADPKAKNRGRQIHDLLQDIATLADEIDENMGLFADQHWDIRKSLKDVIEGQNEVYLKLRAMKDASAADPKLQEEVEEYRLALRDAIEALTSSLDSARKTVQEQALAASDKKLKKAQE